MHRLGQTSSKLYPFAKQLCSLSSDNQRFASLEMKTQSAILPSLNFKLTFQINQAAPMDAEKLLRIEPLFQLIERFVGPIFEALPVVDMNNAIFRNYVTDGVNVQ